MAIVGGLVVLLLLFSGVGFYMPVSIRLNKWRTEEWLDHSSAFQSLQHTAAPSSPGAVDLRDARDQVSDDITRQRRDAVVKMMKHAWNNYMYYAWGENELRPVSKRGRNAGLLGSLGETIVNGLDTLYIMGMMDEFKQGRDWIEKNLLFNKLSSDVGLFLATVKIVGGLLSCYALTGDVMFREKAAQLTEKLLPAFQTETGIPYSVVVPETGWSTNYAWVNGASSILSESGGLHLEFTYLSDITNNPVYRTKVDHVREVLRNIHKLYPVNGLYPNFIDPSTGKWGQPVISLGALGDSFYEYLLKSWIQSGKVDTQARQMYNEAIENILKHLKLVSFGGLTYISDMRFGGLEHKMGHPACFSGALIGLGAYTEHSNTTDYYMDVAEKVTSTCHEVYDRALLKLAPEVFYFTNSAEGKSLRYTERGYYLQPQTFESYFILWRLTKNPKYREWGWEAVQALEKQCRVSGGYTGVKSVYTENPAKDDVQHSVFLAETLKYLYLLFSDDDLISLDQWVFNTEGHPLPIKGVNPYYRQFKV